LQRHKGLQETMPFLSLQHEHFSHQNFLKMATYVAVAHTKAVTQFLIGRHRTPLKIGRTSIQSR